MVAFYYSSTLTAARAENIPSSSVGIAVLLLCGGWGGRIYKFVQICSSVFARDMRIMLLTWGLWLLFRTENEYVNLFIPKRTKNWIEVEEVHWRRDFNWNKTTKFKLSSNISPNFTISAPFRYCETVSTLQLLVFENRKRSSKQKITVFWKNLDSK